MAGSYPAKVYFCQNLCMKIDILAFGAHPDDVELACSGTLLKHKAMGRSTGIVDLTRGELGTRGSAELRDQESGAAALILGLDVRENLGFKDGFFTNDEYHRMEVIKKIRLYSPDIVFTNAPSDRHPDHGNGYALVSDACFLSGLSKIKTEIDGKTQVAWRPRLVLHYIQDRYFRPDIVVDVSAYFEKRMDAILAYKSQFFNPESNQPQTYISSPEFLNSLKSRPAEWGRLIGVPYAEGFLFSRVTGIDNLFSLI
jgi:bacillithiol biosynthesis deacetylase BshB1